MIQFDAPKEMSSIIKVVGVGGGGTNAVNHMYGQGIEGVDFIICNTDAQALDSSPVPTKVQLGDSLTEGRGAGSIPAVGKDAAMENIQDIRKLLEENTRMLFITAGMGGGTGTGAAPVIAAVAKEMNILTVGIVTIPFTFEGRKRKMQADAGIEELRKNVDTLLIISNDKLRLLYGNLKLSEAFGKADDILTDAAKGIAEIITVTGYVNVDFEDVKTVMKDSGVAIMGTGSASGEDRAQKAIEMALASPLLNDNDIEGASNILLYIASGDDEMEMDEIGNITDFIQEEAGLTAEVIWGMGNDPSLGDAISVTLIATGFETNSDVESTAISHKTKKEKVVVHNLDDTEAPKNQMKSESYDDGIKLIDKTPVVEDRTDIGKEVSELLSQPSTQAPTASSQPETKVVIHTLGETEEDPIEETRNTATINNETVTANIPDTDFQKKAAERIARLQKLSKSFTDAESLAESENVPAYKRRGVSLSDTPASHETNVSRYTLDSETGEMKSNNSFLHDNVD